MHWRRLRPCPSPCHAPYDICSCEGGSIDKSRIIGLDSSNLSKPPKLCLATRLWRVQRRDLAGTVHYIEQQPEHHRTRTFQEEYLAFLKKHGAHFDEKYLWDEVRPIIPYPTGRFLFRHAFPGTACQATIGMSLRDVAGSYFATASRLA